MFQRSGPLDGDVHVRGLVLDRLEGADRHAELDPLLHVRDDEVEDAAAASDGGDRQAHQGHIRDSGYRKHYLGDADPRDPRVSPLLADDHSRLPAALIQVGEHDPLRDDGARYAAALRAAGVPVRLTEYVGMPHGFLNFPAYAGAHHRPWPNCAQNSGPRSWHPFPRRSAAGEPEQPSRSAPPAA